MTKTTEQKSKLRLPPISKLAATISLYTIGAVLLVVIALAALTLSYQSRVYPHTTIGGYNFSSLTHSAAETKIKAVTDQLANQKFTIRTSDGSVNKNLSYDDLGVTYSPGQTADNLILVGRSGSLLTSLKQLVAALGQHNTINASYQIDLKTLNRAVSNALAPANHPAVNAHLTLDKTGNLQIVDASPGQTIDENSAVTQVVSALNTLAPVVTLPITTQQPTVTTDEVNAAKPAVAAILARTPLKLTAGDTTANLSAVTVFSWITLQPPTDPTDAGKLAATVQIDHSKVTQYVTDLAKTVNRAAQNAIIKSDNGKLTVSQPQADGQTLNVDKSSAAIVDALNSGATNKTVALQVDVTKADVRSDNLNNLGVSQLIGEGTTSYGYSPSNRIHNIQQGVKTISGTIIPDGKEFSTIKTLGQITAASGYLPELSIVGNQVIPEDGGGLCQVSTTLFRAVLNAGLKVTERQNHSFRVSYYEPPAGLDATIYDPAPDFKFLNDTGHDILVQGSVDTAKHTVTFQLYGTGDGRSSKIGTPAVSNVLPPPSPRYANTDTLPKGTTKKVENAVPGETVDVSYDVSRDGKVINHQNFHSVYVPWPASYLVGTK